MFRTTLLLFKERSHEHEKVIYCNIKKLNFVEKARIYKRITNAQSDAHLQEALETIRKFSNQISNFNIDLFVKVA